MNYVLTITTGIGKKDPSPWTSLACHEHISIGVFVWQSSLERLGEDTDRRTQKLIPSHNEIERMLFPTKQSCAIPTVHAITVCDVWVGRNCFTHDHDAKCVPLEKDLVRHLATSYEQPLTRPQKKEKSHFGIRLVRNAALPHSAQRTSHGSRYEKEDEQSRANVYSTIEASLAPSTMLLPRMKGRVIRSSIVVCVFLASCSEYLVSAG